MTRILLLLAAAVPILAQSPLTLQDAVKMALEKHPALEATAAQTKVAEQRINQARSGYLPRLNYTESWARSNNPVFVFSSLLTQHQFTESNFRIDSLNRPDALNNFQSQLTVDQNVYDWGATRNQIRTAETGRKMTQEMDRGTRLGLMARVARSYYGAVLAKSALDVAREAVKSAEADAQRAQTVRDAGMSTDADLLSIRVHLAAVREQEIRRAYDLQLALAALNESLGMPLDTRHDLTTPLTFAKPVDDAAVYSTKAAANRPEWKQSELAVQMAEQQTATARTALLPQFGARAAFEANRQDFVRKGGANWLVAANMRWNIFDGNVNRSRIAEAKATLEGARAQQKQVNQGVRLEVIKAWTDARSAEERVTVATAAVAQAEESLRIIKNRYESGLATVTDLLRNETALLEVRTRRLAAIHDHRVALAQLELAAGTLSADSEVLQ